MSMGTSRLLLKSNYPYFEVHTHVLTYNVIYFAIEKGPEVHNGYDDLFFKGFSW